MLCRRCTALWARGAEAGKPKAPRSAPVWGADRISGLRCDRCTALLGADDIAQLLLEKQSQLAQFGLLTPRRPPREPRRREDD
jgi:hypothetical protein